MMCILPVITYASLRRISKLILYPSRAWLHLLLASWSSVKRPSECLSVVNKSADVVIFNFHAFPLQTRVRCGVNVCSCSYVYEQHGNAALLLFPGCWVSPMQWILSPFRILSSSVHLLPCSTGLSRRCASTHALHATLLPSSTMMPIWRLTWLPLCFWWQMRRTILNRLFNQCQRLLLWIQMYLWEGSPVRALLGINMHVCMYLCM